jgi:hypothetical protein
MPNLKQLIEELEEMGDKPREIRLPGSLYDDLVDQADDGLKDRLHIGWDELIDAVRDHYKLR